MVYGYEEGACMVYGYEEGACMVYGYEEGACMVYGYEEGACMVYGYEEGACMVYGYEEGACMVYGYEEGACMVYGYEEGACMVYGYEEGACMVYGYEEGACMVYGYEEGACMVYGYEEGACMVYGYEEGACMVYGYEKGACMVYGYKEGGLHGVRRRRRSVKRRDGSFNYSPDIYCNLYDENTGICPNGEDCPYLHRNAGDTERRYHLRYYKTSTCVYETDLRGYCVKNGPHCAFAHGAYDLRIPIYDSKEGEEETTKLVAPLVGSLEKERGVLVDDPRWQDSSFVLTYYKTEQCRRPPRLCRQGYACPFFHNNKDRRRSPKCYKYRRLDCTKGTHRRTNDQYPKSCVVMNNNGSMDGDHLCGSPYAKSLPAAHWQTREGAERPPSTLENFQRAPGAEVKSRSFEEDSQMYLWNKMQSIESDINFDENDKMRKKKMLRGSNMIRQSPGEQGFAPPFQPQLTVTTSYPYGANNWILLSVQSTIGPTYGSSPKQSPLVRPLPFLLLILDLSSFSLYYFTSLQKKVQGLELKVESLQGGALQALTPQAALETMPLSQLVQLQKQFRQDLSHIETCVSQRLALLCVACKELPRCVVFQPCQHLVLCEKCVEGLGKEPKCPHCGTRVTQCSTAIIPV
eukprot:Em0888g3a